MRSVIAVLYAAFCVGAANPAGLSEIHTVYLLPMSNAMDQYLANRLSKTGPLVVVTDPAQADAVISDGLGESFERKMAELYPPPPPPKKAEAEKEEGAYKEDSQQQLRPATRRGRGNVFLVDRKSRQVLWSTYARPKNTMPDQLDKTAGHVAEQLRRVLTGQK